MHRDARRARARLVALLLPLAGLTWLAEPSVAQPAQVGCHQRLGPGRPVTLASDLICGPGSDDRQPALVVLGPVTVDLGGHSLTCVGGLRFGILVGSNVRLVNGVITGCNEAIVTEGSRNALERLTLAGNDVGISIDGGARNTLIGIEADHNRLGIRLTDGANGNTVSDSTASNNADVGFLVSDGQRNVLTGNRSAGNGRGFLVGGGESRTELTGNSAEDNAGDGFLVTGTSSIVLEGNRARSNGGDGYQILDATRTQVRGNEAGANAGNGFLLSASGGGAGDGNALERNTAVDNGMNGIAIDRTSAHNQVRGNTATGHAAPFFDLLDLNPDCRRPANAWTRNTFGTASPDCLR